MWGRVSGHGMQDRTQICALFRPAPGYTVAR